MWTAIEFLFPRRLGRLSYFIRLLICNGFLFYLSQDAWGETTLGIVTLIAVLLYAGFFVLMPRIRDLGMQSGWIILAFIPYVSTFLGVALLFRRSNHLRNPLLQRGPGE